MRTCTLYPDRPVIQRGLIVPLWFITLPNGEKAIRKTFEDALNVVDHYHRTVKEGTP